MEKSLKIIEVRIKNNRNLEKQKSQRQIKLAEISKKFKEETIRKMRRMEEMYNV